MKSKRKSSRGKRGKRGGKMAIVMHEFKHGKLHSGSKRGPKVKDRKQAIAIGLNQARREGEDVAPRGRRKSTRSRRRTRRSTRR